MWPNTVPVEHIGQLTPRYNLALWLIVCLLGTGVVVASRNQLPSVGRQWVRSLLLGREGRLEQLLVVPASIVNCQSQ